MNEFVDLDSKPLFGQKTCVKAFRGNALEKRIKVRKVLDS